MLLHGIPGIDLDVAMDDAVVIPGFEPDDMQDLSSFAGQTLVNRRFGFQRELTSRSDQFGLPA